MSCSYDPTLFPEPPALPLSQPDLKVGIILVPSFPILPLASFIDCLRIAADSGDFSRQIFCRWKVMSEDGAPVSASSGIAITPNGKFSDPKEFNYLAVIGGLLPGQLKATPALRDYLLLAARSKTTIIGICTGTFLLADIGLLDGRRCCVHTYHRRQLAGLYPNIIPISNKTYIDDGRIITAQGGSATLDLVTFLIERHCGRARAVKSLIAALQIDPRRAGGQFPPRPFGELATCGNPRVEKAFEMMEQKFENPVQISKLAEFIGISNHELNRVFHEYAGTSPSEVYRKIRLEHARWLLSNSSHSITFIAMECGFSDSAHLARWFKRSFGESPRRYRNVRLGTD